MMRKLLCLSIFFVANNGATFAESNKKPVGYDFKPVPHVYNPQGKIQKPVHHVVKAKPVHHVAKPVHHAAKPVHHAVKPVHHAVKPVHHAVKPVHHAVKPVHHAVKPVHQVVKPVHQVVKPVQKITYTPIPHVYAPIATPISTMFNLPERTKPVTPTAKPHVAKVKQPVEPKVSYAQKLMTYVRKSTPTYKIKPINFTLPKSSYQGFAMGPYVGASVGVRINGSGAPASYYGGEGTLSLGYGHLWNRFYLAAELVGGESTTLRNLPNSPSDMLSGWSLGGDLIPGYLINDKVLGYLRLGGVSTQFNMANVNQGAWQVGLGGQTNLNTNLDLRGEYIYSQYQAIEAMGTPHSSQFNLGLVYKFV